jgi:hypothetical protein
LAAGCFGTPVCIDTQMTQMTIAQPEKNSSVNQSISAETLRSRVGKANAAKVASAGRANSKERSDAGVSSVVPMATARKSRGQAR